MLVPMIGGGDQVWIKTLKLFASATGEPNELNLGVVIESVDRV